jgi:hypothetical protein
VCGRASESTIIGLIIPESATGIVTNFDIGLPFSKCDCTGSYNLVETIWFLSLIKIIDEYCSYR